MSKNYEFRDSRMEKVRADAVLEQGQTDYVEVLCAECGALIAPEDSSYVHKTEVYCTYCIESWSALEEEGRVPEEFQIPT